jgi:hypothetical protein
MEMEQSYRLCVLPRPYLQHRLDRARRLYAPSFFIGYLFADNLDHPSDSHTWP